MFFFCSGKKFSICNLKCQLYWISLKSNFWDTTCAVLLVICLQSTLGKVCLEKWPDKQHKWKWINSKIRQKIGSLVIDFFEKAKNDTSSWYRNSCWLWTIVNYEYEQVKVSCVSFRWWKPSWSFVKCCKSFRVASDKLN